MKVSNERFVEVWQAAESGTEAAKRLGMRLNTAVQRAGYLRRAGVPMKRFKSTGVDVDALTKKAKKSAR